ncbi:MAG: tRNA 2-thiouridine(34) synthase MnmA [Myxococcota bacterium]|jgi:tRNA-specific 2-thiouridylase|nr:tRNA 2-thiouridine(34) synthase MnmA [Myxococcota bacterium]
MSTRTIIAAMSGGVDSSVAAGLLVEAGHRVIGATLSMKPCAEEGEYSWCCGKMAETAAAQVACRLGIAHYVLDVAEDFETHVLRHCWDEYAAGRTPSPCLVCNQRIKLGRLLALADDLGADAVATGHYARLAPPDERGPVLRRGVDLPKDQSYFLSQVRRHQLERAAFPLGELTKPQVRDLARRMGFHNAERKESQDACFSHEQGFAEGLRRRFAAEVSQGEIRTADGRVVGTHQGLHRYTVGQRKGLGIALGERAYVVRLDTASNAVVLSDRIEDLETPGLEASDLNWIVPTPEVFHAQVQIRYRSKPVEAEVHRLPDKGARVVFETPQKAVTKGQALAVYEGDRVIGGGWIDKA